ncbi:MAG TPA: PfkB family carbohydrate kinase [Mycobacteriales bacterium]|nr:PfkB family carbohydrate kinase [Mycobacteriales bacterium]
MRILCAGQIARDLALLVADIPEPGATQPVRKRREMLGGKGANQAVAATQLGAPAGLIGVVGDDQAGEWLLRNAAADGIDVGTVVPRAGARSALIVDIVDGSGAWRYLEDIPVDTLLRPADIAAAEFTFSGADAVVLQLQQPAAAALAAAAAAKRHAALLVLDGAPPAGLRDALLAQADVVRADAQEAALWTGRELPGPQDVRAAAEQLRAAGPSVVLFAGSEGNVVAWPGGSRLIPLAETAVVDTTGGGDAFTAGFTVDYLRHGEPERAARFATAAASLVVERLGGRPDLEPAAVEHRMSAGLGKGRRR